MSGLNDTQRRLKEKWLVQTNRWALKAIDVDGLRGLCEARVEFRYPVVAIGGGNGSGKTTLLTLAACGYHGHPSFVPPNCKPEQPYYTFNDFFVGSKRDGHFEGSTIQWTYYPDSPKPSLKIHKKSKSKWMHYDRRPHRPVVYIGLERVLPAAERRVLRRHFGGTKVVANTGLSDAALKAVNAITRLKYSEVGLAKSKGHRIFQMSRGAANYSSFHSGAGEEVVCELASLLDSIPNNALVLVEEIEAGLHPALQAELIRHLTEIALDREVQVIVTTHSTHVMSSVPPEGRVFLKRLPNGATSVEYGVNPAYVLSELTGRAQAEVTIYVEDDVAANLVRALLPSQVRRRVRIQPLGSFTLLAAQAAAYHADKELGNALFIVDGDIHQERWNDYICAFKKGISGDTSAGEAWLKSTTVWFPEHQPERLLWDVAVSKEGRQFLCARGYQEEDLLAFAAMPEPADWHTVPLDFAKSVCETVDKARRDLCDAAVHVRAPEFAPIRERVTRALDAGGREKRG